MVDVTSSFISVLRQQNVYFVDLLTGFRLKFIHTTTKSVKSNMHMCIKNSFAVSPLPSSTEPVLIFEAEYNVDMDISLC